MSNRRLGPRVAIVVSAITLVASIAGFVIVLVTNVFVLDKFNAYGEVPIPGNADLQLPAGEATISFHTLTTGSTTSGFPVPPLKLTLIPPDGVAKPQLSESRSGTTTVNSDVRVRVWVAQIAEAGTYTVVVDGDVNGYINPRLAFGHDSSSGGLVWIFAGLFALSVLGFLAAVFWAAFGGKRIQPILAVDPESPDVGAYGAGGYDVGDSGLDDSGADESPAGDYGPAYGAAPASSYIPTDQGIRLQQLKTLAALRDSGALTEKEFEEEKRRILEG